MINKKMKADSKKVRSISQKLRGGYYTPKEITQFICNWGINENTFRVLEPSCGDGNFVEAAIKRFNMLGVVGETLTGRIKAIELVEEESLKAKLRAKELGLNSTTIVHSDFFNYVKNRSLDRYDLILGNPPFIRYQNFPEEHRHIAIEMMQDLKLNPSKLTNIWVPFLVVSASLLKETGKLGMVIPAELFQVKYAAETRIFLSKYFQRITIITFRKLVFSDIQQEVVLLLCEREAETQPGIRVIECESLDDLAKLDFNRINNSRVKPIDHSTEKWTKYFLDQNEIELLRRLKNDERIGTCGEIMEVDVGLVTGRNEFFMLNEDEVDRWDLRPYTIQVASKSNQLKGISLSAKDLKENSDAGNNMYLFIPPNLDFKDLPRACQKYVRFGEQMNFHIGYKCSIRKRWYVTPSLWAPDAFALRQVGEYPKLILNLTKASSTDTIHRVRFRTGVQREIVPALFLNSLTFAFSEVTGRSYGGGVLTFEPTEIEELRIPKIHSLSVDFEEIDHLIRLREIDRVLEIIDNALLIKQVGLESKEVAQLKRIWTKLASRRLNRSRINERKKEQTILPEPLFVS